MPPSSLTPPTSPQTTSRPAGRWLTYVSYLVLGLGLLLRVVVWAQQRSIVLDEANLLHNYADKTYGQLFQPLDYEQYAPPLFSVIVKFCIQTLGNNELAARLFPLLCSMATVVLFRRLCLRWLPGPFACLALGFVAFGQIFIDYATECKQYATDGFVVLGLLEVAHWALRRPLTNRLALGMAGLGMVAVWLSMPAIFALAGIGLWWLVQRLRQHDTPAVLRIAGIGACWVGSFLLYFFLLLNTSAKLSNLQTFHQDYFLAFPPRSGAQLRLLGSQLSLMADRAIGKTVLALILAAVGFGVGVWQFLKARGEGVWFFLFPIGACLAASALHYYSLVPRLTLFFLPLVVLVVFKGIAALATGRVAFPLLLLLSVLVLLNQQRLPNLVKPFYGDYAEVRDGLRYIARHQQPADKVYMNYNVAPIAQYYQAYHTPPIPLKSVVLQPIRNASDETMHQDIIRLRQQGASRLWLLYDRADESFSQFAATQGRIAQRFDFQRGYVLLLEFR